MAVRSRRVSGSVLSVREAGRHADPLGNTFVEEDDVISKDDEARIIRLFHVEKWRVGAIAKQIGVHHSTVARMLDRRGHTREVAKRPSQIDPYLAFIAETLERFPDITASRVFGMARERGYEGGPDHFRHAIKKLRKRKRSEAFIRLKTLAGEEAQVDWAYFGRVRIGRAERQLMAFVMVLSYSRRLFVHFFLGQVTAHFLRGHVMAFNAFGGSPRRILYDNLKSAVLNRRGDAIQFNPDLLAIAVYYTFEPRPVGVRRGNEKGRVERAIRYVRTAFFEALAWRTLEDLNEKARAFCEGPAMARAWPEDETKTVSDAFLEEKSTLLTLPPAPFPVLDRVEVEAKKTPYVRFDLNDYSIPHDRIGRPLTVVATLDRVRIMDGTAVVADHRRSFDRGDVIEERGHIQEILKLKRNAKRGFALDRLTRMAPETTALLRKMADRGANIGSATFRLGKLLDLYGADDLRYGVREAIFREVFHLHAVRQAIERRRDERGLGPALAIQFPDDPRITDLVVTPHDLSSYDNNKEINDDGHRPEAQGEEDPVEA
jgi:transposase